MATAGSYTFNSTTGLISMSAGTSGAKGAWVEMISSTSAAANSLLVWVCDNQGSNANAVAFDIGTGGSGSESVLIPDITMSAKANGFGNTGVMYSVCIPVAVASGTRLSMRYSSDEDRGPQLGGIVANQDGHGYTTVETIGVVTDGEGVEVDPGTTINTYGSWVELKASTTNAVKSLLVCTNIGNNGNVDADYHRTVQIGTGGSGSEVAIDGVREIPCFNDTGERWRNGMSCFDVDISASTRISARCQSSSAVSTDRIMNVNCIGFS